ncbi:hypothetical protein RBH20_07345 [Haloarcula sp. H-GB4]|nr:hypothetical protein [Haloarcula sp. H-GB4]MDQ2072352.1 hypothetical protein [Haloarcula sp. H-GB4]
MGGKTYQADLELDTWRTLKKVKTELVAETNPELVDKLLEEAGFDGK